MRTLLIAIIVLLQCLLGYFYFRDFQKCCTTEKDSIQSQTTEEKNNGPLLFSWSNYEPVLDNSWQKMKDSILVSLTNDQKLEITALYSAEESPPSNFENAGIARASSVRKLFPEIEDDRISISAKLANPEMVSKTTLFEAVSFATMNASESIKKSEDKTLIYFASNSATKINNAEVESYLNEIAERVIKSGEKIGLTGHTDNIGPEASNLVLGRRRAETVRQYLITKGVPASNITVDSKGESEPIADNDSEDGRTKNRRTELSIFK